MMPPKHKASARWDVYEVHESTIINKYKGGSSMQLIASQSRVPIGRVRKILVEAGVELRPPHGSVKRCVECGGKVHPKSTLDTCGSICESRKKRRLGQGFATRVQPRLKGNW